jgi:uncharacterized membrane protein
VSQMGLAAAVVLLPQVRDDSMASAPLIALNALGVVAAWAVLNTAYALYYAYIYYGDEEGSGGGDQQEKPRGGPRAHNPLVRLQYCPDRGRDQRHNRFVAA